MAILAALVALPLCESQIGHGGSFGTSDWSGQDPGGPPGTDYSLACCLISSSREITLNLISTIVQSTVSGEIINFLVEDGGESFATASQNVHSAFMLIMNSKRCQQCLTCLYVSVHDHELGSLITRLDAMKSPLTRSSESGEGGLAQC